MIVIKLIPSVLQDDIPIGGKELPIFFACDELPRVQKVVQTKKVYEKLC